MAIDLSISRAIDKCVKKSKELKGAKHDLTNPDIRQDCEIEIGEIINSLVLSMDKVMNAVWRSYVRSQDNKPNVYFPCDATEEKYYATMQRYRLSHLLDDAPELMQLICQIQPYSAGEASWWKILRDLASIRHERFPEIKNARVASGIGIGAHQTVFIEHLSFNGGQVSFKGSARNPLTGQIEPLKFNYFEEIEAELAATNLNPFNFIVMASQNVSVTTKKVGVHL